MATRNFVPRSGSQGQIGTIVKPWDKVIAITSSFSVHSGSITGNELTLVSGSSTSTGSFGHLLIGGTIVAGDISAASSTGSFGRLEVGGDTNLIGDISIGGNINIGDADTDSLTINADLTSDLIPNADSTYDIGSTSKNWKFGYIEELDVTNITASGDITNISTINITASNNISASGDIRSDGRIFEKNTSVIDHATAMAIVFGG